MRTFKRGLAATLLLLSPLLQAEGLEDQLNALSWPVSAMTYA